MKVYLVWETDCRCDILVAIFSTAGKAEQYAKDVFAREFKSEYITNWERYYSIQEREVE